MEQSRFFLLAACIAVLAAGCVAFDGGTPAVDEGELTAIEKTRGHPIYWAGRSIEGYPLTHAEALGSGKYLFIYGDCEIDDQGWFDDGGCTPPVDIQQYPIRARHPGMFDVDVGCRRLVVRRVPAAIFQSSGGALEIYTGASVVVIFGETAAQQRRIAQALRPINTPEEPRDALPAPATDVESALGRCTSID